MNRLSDFLIASLLHEKPVVENKSSLTAWRFATPGFHQRSFDDPAEQALEFAGDAQYRQVSPGSYHGEITCLALPSMLVLRETQNQSVLKRVAFPANVCVVAHLNETSDRIRLGRDKFSYGDLIYAPGGSKTDFQIHGTQQGGGAGFIFDQQLFLTAAKMVHEEYWSLHGAVSLVAKSAAVSQLSLLTDLLLQRASIFGGAFGDREAVDITRLCLSQTISIFGDAIESSMVTPLRSVAGRSYVVVREAREFIDAHFSENITILEICRSLSISRRSLQDAFQKVIGMSPHQYLRRVRLNRVRGLMLNAEPGDEVGNLAWRCGFWHLSLFSQDYQKMFGEKPSETLRRAKRC
jgi:AraC family ethanolamine operon transcriptional activator